MRVTLILFIVCLGLCGTIDASLPSCSMADQQEEGVVGWQYATVRAFSRLSRPQSLWFYADGRTLEVDGWADLLSDLVPQHLLVYGEGSDGNEVEAKGAVLDHLGNQGWELTGVTIRSETSSQNGSIGEHEQWVFKRRR